MRIHATIKNNSYLLIAVVATIFSICYQRYYFGQNDHSIYVPYLKSLMDNSLYHRDIMVQTWKTAYFGNLWKFLAILARSIQIQPLFLLLHILSRFFFFIALFSVMKSIAKNYYTGILAIMLWVIPKPSLGFDVFYNQFVQSEIGITILLFCIYFIFEKRYLLTAVILGITLHIHPPMAGFVSVGFFFSLFWQKKYATLCKSIFIVLALGFPILLPTLLFAKDRIGYDQTWMELTKIRSAHHSFPLKWSVWDVWIPYLVYTVISAVSFVAVQRKMKESGKLLILLLIPMYCIMFAGFIFSEVVPIGKIVAMVPFHISPIITILLSFPIIYLISLCLQRKNVYITLCTLLFIFYYFFANFDFTVSKSEIFLFTALCMIVCFARLLCRYISFQKYLIVSYFIAFTLVIILFWMPIMITKIFTFYDPFTNDWIATQIWANEHTTKNSLFMVPIYIDGFQVYSQRAIVADWKDGTIGYLSPEYLREWWKRMEEFGLTKQNYSDSRQIVLYRNLPTIKIVRFAKEYHIQYFVTEKNQYVYPFQKLYTNTHFIIYKIP